MAGLRIIFFHGLESGPSSFKHRWLNEHYGKEMVTCRDMQMSLYDPRKANSILRSLLAYALCTIPWNLPGWSVRASLDACLEVQRDELAAGRRGTTGGVLIASSWGAAVATLALARGYWDGPTILLAPAYGVFGRWAGKTGDGYSPEEVYLAIARRLRGGSEEATMRQCQLLIVHGTLDDTVPIEDSRAMAAATGIELREIEGGTHGLSILFAEDKRPSLETLIKQVIGSPQSGS